MAVYNVNAYLTDNLTSTPTSYSGYNYFSKNSNSDTKKALHKIVFYIRYNKLFSTDIGITGKL